jgi:hypothetical protein
MPMAAALSVAPLATFTAPELVRIPPVIVYWPELTASVAPVSLRKAPLLDTAPLTVKTTGDRLSMPPLI